MDRSEIEFYVLLGIIIFLVFMLTLAPMLYDWIENKFSKKKFKSKNGDTAEP